MTDLISKDRVEEYIKEEEQRDKSRPTRPEPVKRRFRSYKDTQTDLFDREVVFQGGKVE